mmetsp:Transcript_22548/g.42367  ORF Transcript_22548/g.42367 Transcript_22548/m.42367 type:complete len:185 (+) Transcript_22548:34-588(+)
MATVFRPKTTKPQLAQLLWDIRWLLVLAHLRRHQKYAAKLARKKYPMLAGTVCGRQRRHPVSSHVAAARTDRCCPEPSTQCAAPADKFQARGCPKPSMRRSSSQALFHGQSFPELKRTRGRIWSSPELQCFSCSKELDKHEIYMYSDHPYCSERCRSSHIMEDDTVRSIPSRHMVSSRKISKSR